MPSQIRDFTSFYFTTFVLRCMNDIDYNEHLHRCLPVTSASAGSKSGPSFRHAMPGVAFLSRAEDVVLLSLVVTLAVMRTHKDSMAEL